MNIVVGAVIMKLVSPANRRKGVGFIHVIAFALLISNTLRAQLIPVKSYGIKDGLVDNNVQAVIRDNRGLLWVGTDVGVYWFDGKRFYRPEIKTNITQLYVNGFYKDDINDIWVLTYFNGIYRYHNGRFTNYLLDTLSKDAIKNTISGMVQLDSNEYLVESQQGIYMFDGKKFSVPEPFDTFFNRAINNVALLQDRTLLLGTDTGVFIFRYEKGKLIPLGHILNNQVINKILVSNGKVYIATSKGLLSFEKAGPQRFSSQSKNYLSGKEIKDISADKNGRIWILADSVFILENEKMTGYTSVNGLPENITKIYCDQEGLLWFANLKGLSMLGDEYYEFNPIKIGTLDQSVTRINTDEKNNLWIGAGNGLAVRKNNEYSFIGKIGKEEIGYVAWMYKNINGSLEAGTDAGVLEIDEGFIKKELNLRSTAAGKDSLGRTWFGDVNGRLWFYNGRMLQPLKTDSLIAEMVMEVHPENEYLWVGYRGDGVRKYKRVNDSLLTEKEYSVRTGYNDMRVRSCATDKKGNIIWGTRTNGAFVFSLASGASIAHITEKNGLSANWIKDILCDTDGKIYFATNNGVNIVSGDYKKPVVTQLKIDNDKLNRETNCVLKTGNTFYIGTIEGVLKWMPDKMHRDTVAPPVYFTRIDIQGLKQFLIDPYVGNVGTISLPYDQHVISFEFAGLSLKNPGGIRYYYVLEGQNDEWSPAVINNYVSYNLKPGDYTFKVIAENADGMRSVVPAVFSFVIKPPFWNTWWFISLVAILIILAAYSAYRYKISQLLELELLRNKISTDLHDDIGSTLSSIAILSDMALRESSNTQMLEMIKGIKENSGSLLEKMDDIVWSINPKNDTLENLMVRLQRFAATLLEAKNIDYNIDIAPAIKNIKLSMNYRQHIYLILKETINNLIKYSNCTKAYIGVIYHNNMLEIAVQDNGIGFDTQNIKYGNGIINMQQRARQMKAALLINSRQGEGTKISIRIKIK